MVTGVALPALVGSGSLLARTAIELAERHPISAGIQGEPWCLNCWSPWPCGPAQHAREVCNAAGVDLPTPARRTGSGPDRSRDSGYDDFGDDGYGGGYSYERYDDNDAEYDGRGVATGLGGRARAAY
jgi:hypothetical protein